MKVSFKSQNIVGTLKINDSKFINCYGGYNPIAKRLLPNHMGSKYFYSNMVIKSLRKSPFIALCLHINFCYWFVAFKD